MAKNKHFTVPVKRKEKTNYRRRKLLLKSGKPRLIVRKTLRNIIAQIALFEPKGDKVITTITTKDLKKLGWNYGNNIVTAYFIGMLLGKKAQEKNIKEAILDKGIHRSTKGAKIYAVVKGAVDSGLKIPHGKDILPSQERIEGKHIAQYAEQLKKNQEDFKKQFSLKKDNPSEIVQKAKEFQKKITG